MKLFFQKTGEGEPLIILHGLYGFSDNWVTIGRKLSEYFSVYLVDQRNHGRSPHHPEHNYTVMADDLYELMVSEKLDRAYIVGHSMGGKTAMLFAAMHPCMVARLVVVDIGPGGYANIDTPSPLVLEHMNIMSTLLSTDLKKYSSRTEIERELATTIKAANVRQFMMKNIHRNTDNSFSWKFNIEALSR
jgi:esterase